MRWVWFLWVVTIVVTARSASAEERLTLGSALVLAKTRSPAAREARAYRESADAGASAAIAGYLPSLSVRAGATQSWSESTYRASASRIVENASEHLGAEASARIGWTAFDFGRTPSQVAAARADARAAALRAAGTTIDVERAVASAFLTAVFDEDFVDVERTTVKVRERHAALARGLVQSGLRPPVEEARARVELESARVALMGAEAAQQEDRVALATLLVLDPSAELSLVRPSMLPTLTDDPAVAARRAAERRPDVGAAEADVAARSEDLAATRAARLPRFGVDVEASQRWDRPDSDTMLFPSRALVATASVSVPIFDWALVGRARVLEGQVEAAEARRTAATSRVKGEAAQAAIRARTARAVVAQAKRTAELAAVALAVVEARYQTGVASPLDLFDAAGRDADARYGLVRAERALAIATVDLLAATGRIQEIAR